MMKGDDIRNQRIEAEKDATFEETVTNPEYFKARAVLALWVIAEQLFELRSLIGISLERNK